MQKRSIKDYAIISLKGMAMGAADAVPGVSGGTIAFISGIYEELIETISNVNLSLLTTWKQNGFKEFWNQLNGGFIVALLCGIVLSFVSFMRLTKLLIEQFPVLIWSFFFGLIVISIYFVGKQITKWNALTFFGLILGAIAAYYITSLPSMATNSNPLYLMFAGTIAICAMILPGISGSFILIILGAYKTLSDAIDDFNIKKIGVFVVGAIVGLLSFSHVLKWLFKNYHNTTLALLTGFIAGSLNKIWPWKKTISVMNDQTGDVVPFSSISEVGTLAVHQKSINDFDSFKTVIEQSVLPFEYSKLNADLDPQILLAITLMVFGFVSILILERIAVKNE